MRCWEFRLRVNINYSLLVHPVYLMLVFNEKCDVAPSAVQLYSVAPPCPRPRLQMFSILYCFTPNLDQWFTARDQGGLERDYMSWLETWSPGLMIVYRNVMLICSMLNKTLKTPTLLDSGRPSLCYRFYNWSGFNGSFVLRRLAQSFRRICRSQQQQVGFWYSSVYLQIILP